MAVSTVGAALAGGQGRGESGRKRVPYLLLNSVYAASSVSVGQELGGRWPGGSSPRLGQGCCLLWGAGGSPPSSIPRPRAEDSGSLHRPVCRELRTVHWLPAVESLGGGGRDTAMCSVTSAWSGPPLLLSRSRPSSRPGRSALGTSLKAG